MNWKVLLFLTLQSTLIASTEISSGYSVTADSLGYTRKLPQKEGTQTWKKLESPASESKFSPRHSHATCLFPCPHNKEKKCIWLTGGRTELYRTWDLKMEDRAADIWYSDDGRLWHQVKNITGDFLDVVGNFNAKRGGKVAPWFSRYGHSLDAVDTDGDGIDDIMILMAGFEPLESNDIWISHDGFVWYFVGYAPWPARAWHSTVVLHGKLFVIGGTPLSNDVWSGTFIRNVEKRSGYMIHWRVETESASFAPRCAMCAFTHSIERDRLIENTTEVLTEKEEYIYLIGGFAGWPKSDSRWDGERTRNDVWRSLDGKNWERMTPPRGKNTMAFVGRGWHACTSWHKTGEKHIHIQPSSGLSTQPARMFLSGGGYIGSKGNNVVTNMEGYTDLFWSVDGSEWFRVNHEEGRVQNLYSTNEFTSTELNGKKVYRGKWGHSMISLPVDRDLNGDNVISNSSNAIEFCTGIEEKAFRCIESNVEEVFVPSLFVIGGDTTDGGPVVNDVFVSMPGVLCEKDGLTCSGQGSCAPGVLGCVCDSEERIGNYCEAIDETYSSGSNRRRRSFISLTLTCVICMFFLSFF